MSDSAQNGRDMTMQPVRVADAMAPPAFSLPEATKRRTAHAACRKDWPINVVQPSVAELLCITDCFSLSPRCIIANSKQVA